MMVETGTDPSSRVDLLWIPLGAGARSVRFNGQAYEAFAALRERRARQDLYHSALQVSVPDGRFVIEVTPIPDQHGEMRGVVGEGPVGCGSSATRSADGATARSPMPAQRSPARCG